MYKAGDVFPRLGKEVTENRLKELSSKENKRGEKLIECEPEPAEEIIEKEAPVERRRRRKNARADSQVD